MKPFHHNGALSREEQLFNYRISSARIVVENSYGRVKGRWRRLMERNDMHIDNIPTIIAAACVLHRDGFNERPKEIRHALCFFAE